MASAAPTHVPSSPPMATTVASSADATASSPAALSSGSSTAPGGSVAAGPSASVFQKIKHISFWDEDGAGVDAWIGTIPGPFQNIGAGTPNANGDTKDSTTIKTEQGAYHH